jgi:hypothetical protein
MTPPRPLLHLFGVLALLYGIGCGKEDVQRYRIPKESPSPRPGMSPSMTGDVPPPPQVEGEAALKWTLPKGWSSSGSTGMRFATLKPSIPGRIDVSVVVLPGPAGGELANVNRWRGQIGLPPVDETTLSSQRTVIRSKAGSVSLFDFSSQDSPSTRMVVGLLQTTDGNTWFLKMTGDTDPVGRAKPDFLKWMESLRLD